MTTKLSKEELVQAVIDTSKPKRVVDWQEWFAERGWTQQEFRQQMATDVSQIVATPKPRKTRAKKGENK